MFKFQVKWPGQVPKIQSNPTQSNPIQSNPIQFNRMLKFQVNWPSQVKPSWASIEDIWKIIEGEIPAADGLDPAADSIAPCGWNNGDAASPGLGAARSENERQIQLPIHFFFLILWFDWCSFRRLIYSLWNSFGPWLQFNSTGSNPSFNHSSHRRREILLRPRLQFPPPFF